MKPNQQKINEKKNSSPKKNFTLLKYISILYLTIISIAFFVNYNQTFDEKIDLNGDNIHYYSLGKALSEGKGFTSVMGLKESPHTHFPPGYPCFIALLMKCGFNSVHSIKVANGFLLFFSLILLYFILFQLSRNRLVAFATAFFTALHPQLLRFSCIMMSEMLFILLACLVLLIILRYPPEKLFENKKKRWRDMLILCSLVICLGYIYLVRVMGLTFILAVIAYFGICTVQKLFLLCKNRKKQDIVKQYKIAFFKYGFVMLLCIISFIIPKTGWDIRNKSIGKTNDAYTSAYLAKKNNGKMETMADWKERLKNNSSNYLAKYVPSSVLLYNVDVDHYPSETGKYPSTKEWLIGVLFLALLLFGAAKSQNWLLLFFYTGITLLVLLGWQEQYGGHRYMTPIIPFLIFLFFNGITNLTTLVFRIFKNINPFIPKIVQIFVLFICAYFMYPNYMKAQDEFRQTAKIKSWEKHSDLRMVNYIIACKFCKDNIPDSARVITRKPELFYMFSGYKKSTSFPWFAEPDTIIAFLKKQQATHLIIDDWFRHASITLVPTVQKYPEKFKVLQMIGKVDTVEKQNPTYVLEFNDEWGYHGERIDGKKTGEGYEFLQDGRKYVGNYANDLPNGFGTLYDAQGNVIVQGKWRNGMFVGK